MATMRTGNGLLECLKYLLERLDREGAGALVVFVPSILDAGGAAARGAGVGRHRQPRIAPPPERCASVTKKR